MPTTAGRRRCRSPRWAARRWRRSRPRAASSATRRRRWPSWSCPSSRAPRPPCRASSRMTDPSEAIEAWRAAASRLSWERPAERTHVPGPRGGSWFPGGMLNVCANCLDRHLAERGDRVAFHWEGEPGDRRAITYRELHEEVCAFAAVLAKLGVGAGDRVALHLGLLPETLIAMLACTRVGAVHAVMAAALPADALTDRLVDFDPKLL